MLLTFEMAMTAALAAVSLISTWTAIYMTWQRAELKDLRAKDEQMVGELAALKTLVAGDYVKRSEFQATMEGQTKLLLAAIQANRDLTIQGVRLASTGEK